LVRGFFNLGVYPNYFRRIVLHSIGRMAEDEKTFIPEMEYTKVYRRARAYLAIYVGVIAVCCLTGNILPVLLVGGVNLFGAWLMPIYGLTQHAGMAENVLDHRLNCRTVHMNLLNRYLYWNMNYHTEHHMFPLVPYHALPRLHALVKDDTPKPYSGLGDAWKEIIPALLRQVKDPTWHVVREIPEPTVRMEDVAFRSNADPDTEGWVEACCATELHFEDVIQFDHKKKTFAVVRDNTGRLFATDGICTHGNSHLADGLVKGGIIECPKHNGRFNLKDGSPARAPICRGLATYPVEERNGYVWLNVLQPGGEGARCEKTYALRVVSNDNVATFIKELVLEPVSEKVDFTPGDYLQFDIPGYERISFGDFDVPAPYAEVWARQGLLDLSVGLQEVGRRNNYSLASNSATGNQLRFNVRIATPPEGQAVPPGAGSSYVFNLKPGDEVSAIGSFGDFHIKPTQKEMVYIGGGAGMAPIRAHIAHLFETEKTARKVSYWYGARSKQELFYDDYFQTLENEHPNFEFHMALSDPLEEDRWKGATGYIHDVVLNDYLKNHPLPGSCEFYLCGPPAMIKACIGMLSELGVPDEQVAFDEF
jgi:MocE subfamily Rieske [2Fe-2S] domain protein